MAELKRQIASLTQKDKRDEKNVDSSSRTMRANDHVQGDCLIATAANPQPARKAPIYSKPWFCFKCGEDGHIAASCDGEANPALVCKKNTDLRIRREKYQMTREASQQTLNY